MGNCISQPRRRSTSYYPPQVLKAATVTATRYREKDRSTYISPSTKHEDGSFHSSSSDPETKEKCVSESTHTFASAMQGHTTKVDIEGDSTPTPSSTNPGHQDDEKDSTHAFTSAQQGGQPHTSFTGRIESDAINLPPPTSPHSAAIRNEGAGSIHPHSHTNSTHEDHGNGTSNSTSHQEICSTHPLPCIKNETGSTQPSATTCASSDRHFSTGNNNASIISPSQTGNRENSAQSHNAKLVSCKPGKPVATDVTSTSVDIEWAMPELSAENVVRCTILYRCASDPDDRWREQKANGASEIVTVSGLTGKGTYYFKVQAEFEDGVRSESDISDPVTILESVTLKNVIERAWEARIKWYWIGIQLEMEATDLDVIRITNNDRPDSCFREMIMKWLKLTGGSWKKLIGALNHKSVDHHELARSLATEIGLTEAYKNAESDAIPDEPGRYNYNSKYNIASND